MKSAQELHTILTQLVKAFEPYHQNDMAARPWLAEALAAIAEPACNSYVLVKIFKCAGCGREESVCSFDPCADVIADREATL